MSCSLNVSSHRWLRLVHQTMADGVEDFSKSLEILILGMLSPLNFTIKGLKQMAWTKGSLYLHLIDSNILFFLNLTNACFLDRQNTKSATKNLELILSGLSKPINRSANQISELHDSLKREYENHILRQNFPSSLLQAVLIWNYCSHGSRLPHGLYDGYQEGMVIVNILTLVLESERRELFKWMSQIPYKTHHKTVGKNLLPKSGLWLQQKTDFIQWRKSSSSSILWLHGIRKFF